jgi:hypothetical protein
MGTVFRLWVLAIAVQIYACFVLLLGKAGEPARDFTEFLFACCGIVQHPLYLLKVT